MLSWLFYLLLILLSGLLLAGLVTARGRSLEEDEDPDGPFDVYTHDIYTKGLE